MTELSKMQQEFIVELYNGMSMKQKKKLDADYAIDCAYDLICTINDMANNMLGD